ncbi:hypothetical protein CEXT_12661 [Caerostris extrusa]|uniref:Uncharacterized protein n=1 Tax=Caerostris extrusa TaxID=172846 RepID=A0AAV4VYB7_CAEEX|nr:hypothetical protein CEXT_12661 [Caerostris extrusa]
MALGLARVKRGSEYIFQNRWQIFPSLGEDRIQIARIRQIFIYRTQHGAHVQAGNYLFGLGAGRPGIQIFCSSPEPRFDETATYYMSGHARHVVLGKVFHGNTRLAALMNAAFELRKSAGK